MLSLTLALFHGPKWAKLRIFSPTQVVGNNGKEQTQTLAKVKVKEPGNNMHGLQRTEWRGYSRLGHYKRQCRQKEVHHVL